MLNSGKQQNSLLKVLTAKKNKKKHPRKTFSAQNNEQLIKVTWINHNQMPWSNIK